MHLLAVSPREMLHVAHSDLNGKERCFFPVTGWTSQGSLCSPRASKLPLKRQESHLGLPSLKAQH